MVGVLTTLGVGSGIDTTALIDALVKAERDPRDAALAARSTKVEARVSGLSQVRSGLTALVTALTSRTQGGALGPLPGSSDTSVVAASATNGATPLLNPAELEVKTLAAGQTLVSASLAAGAAVGKGVLTLRSGTLTPDGSGGFEFSGNGADAVEVTIDDRNDTLGGLRDAINVAQVGRANPVQASIIADSTGARLVLKGPTGAAAGFILTADPADPQATPPGLTRFVHSPAVTAMTTAATARDAALVLDGVAVTRPKNNFSDLIDGVTLDLRKASPGSVVTIAATRDGDGLKTAVRDLVAALNALNTLTAGLVKAGSDGVDAGVLAGDGTMRRLRGQLTALTATPTTPGVGGLPSRLADLGIVTGRDGGLTIDETRLGAAVAAAPDAVERLLVALTVSTVAGKGPLATIAAGLSGGAAGGADSRYTREQAAITRDKTALDGRMTAYRATLVKQYAAMEQAVAASKSIQTFLKAQIDAWNQTDT